MESKFNFEQLNVWHLAMNFSENINLIIDGFPDHEKYNLVSQTIRAADSIALNLAEGATGQSKPEFKRFIGYSMRSTAEVVTCLHKAHRRKYIDEETFSSGYVVAFELMNKLSALRKSLG